MDRLLVRCLCVAALAAPVSAADLLVPSVYATLQAALDAANPGDRILLDAPIQEERAVVRKSVTIESFGAARQSILFWPQSPGLGIQIEALTPGLPLTLRRIDITVYNFLGNGSAALWTRGHVAGELRLDDVSLTWGTGGQVIWSGTLLQLDLDRVWLRRCTLLAHDAISNPGCVFTKTNSGTSCMAITANFLHMEDCSATAGSSNYLTYLLCSPYVESPFGGPGGTALAANTQLTVLVRCHFSDANGGSVEPGPWQLTPAPGLPVPSVFGGAGGTVEAFQVTHEAGLAGQITRSPSPSRGTTVSIGRPVAPLTVGGSGQVGGTVDLNVSSFAGGTSAVALLGFGWGLAPTPFGNLLLDPTLPIVLVPFGSPSTVTFRVPPDCGAVHLPVVAQLFTITSPPVTVTAENPSGLAIRK